ncbi:hypothetical protein E4U41_000609 [Claviceps citrina]|nr:hypothetical protein E4U41_000609 [Claviceps citrina]
MPSLTTYLAAAGLAALAVADTVKITAKGNSTFSPDSVTAKAGDVLEFHFQSRNHSVVAGDYKFPCFPLPMATGFFSGFVPVESGESDKVFRVKLADANPLVFYSSQGDECSRGMVGIVNPNDEQTLQSYKWRASQLATGVTPSTSFYGGELADEKASNKTNDQNQGKKDDNADSQGLSIFGGKNDTDCGAQDDKVSSAQDDTDCDDEDAGFSAGKNDTDCDVVIQKSSVDMLTVPLLGLAVTAGAIAAFVAGL